MGCLFTYGITKADIMKDLTAPEEKETRQCETIADRVLGQVHWSVVGISQLT